MKRVGIVMGSDSDLDIMSECANKLKEFQIPYEMRIMSAHRTPYDVQKFACEAYDKGLGVIIAAAGKAAHLAGFIAANTCLPVIGVPIKASALEGLDALLATVQMPSGIPVATVAINGAANAALLAAQILAAEDKTLYDALIAMRKSMAEAVRKKDKALQNNLIRA